MSSATRTSPVSGLMILPPHAGTLLGMAVKSSDEGRGLDGLRVCTGVADLASPCGVVVLLSGFDALQKLSVGDSARFVRLALDVGDVANREVFAVFFSLRKKVVAKELVQFVLVDKVPLVLDRS